MSSDLATRTAAPRSILLVLSESQRLEYGPELLSLEDPALDFVFEPSADKALDLVGELRPKVVVVGMTTDEMDGLEFLALVMRRYKDFTDKLVVLPSLDDPFPPVIQSRDPETGRSRTEESSLAGVRELIRSIGAMSPSPLRPADSSIAIAARVSARPTNSVPPDMRAAALLEPEQEKASPAQPPAATPSRVAPRPTPATATPARASPSPSRLSGGVKPTPGGSTTTREEPTKPVEIQTGSFGDEPETVPILASPPAPDQAPAARVEAALVETAPAEDAGTATTIPAPKSVESNEIIPSLRLEAPSAWERSASTRSHQSSAVFDRVTREWRGLTAGNQRLLVGAAASVVALAVLLLLLLFGRSAATSSGSSSFIAHTLSSSDLVPPLTGETAANHPKAPAVPAATLPSTRPEANLEPKRVSSHPANITEGTVRAEATAPGGNSTLQTLPLMFQKGRVEYEVPDPAAFNQAVAEIIRQLSEDPTLTVEVGGHSSAEGSHKLNSNLGYQRAMVVERHLIQQGVSPDRIRKRTYGAYSPISPGSSHNRRVTIRFKKEP